MQVSTAAPKKVIEEYFNFFFQTKLNVIYDSHENSTGSHIINSKSIKLFKTSRVTEKTRGSRLKNIET